MIDKMKTGHTGICPRYGPWIVGIPDIMHSFCRPSSPPDLDDDDDKPTKPPGSGGEARV